MDRKRMIREFLQGLMARKGDAQPFSDVSSLLLSGRLQSVDAIEVAVFLETEFGVDFATIGFDEEKIDSVDVIVALVEESSRSGS